MLSAIPPASEPVPRRAPRRLDVGPVRERLRALLEAGMTSTDIAVAAGIGRTTLYRILRPDVRGVHVDTATALDAVNVWAWRERAASSRTTAPQRDKAITRAQRRHANVLAAGGHFINGRATNAPRRKRAPGEEPPHGTPARYMWRFDPCRCDDCRTAMNAARAARKRAQRRRLAGSAAP
jgi:Helix-turn-helix domain of resolvase